MKREYKDYIEDIVDSMKKSMKFFEHMSFDAFAKDDKTIFAVVRALEIIWNVVKERIPALKPSFERILEDL